MNLYSKHRVTKESRAEAEMLELHDESLFKASYDLIFFDCFLFSFFFKNPLRRFVTFLKNLSIFRLLKTFLSYQQVINNSPFSTQFFENLSENRSILGTFSRLY